MWIIKEYKDRFDVYLDKELIESYPSNLYVSEDSDINRMHMITSKINDNNRVFSCSYDLGVTITILDE